MPERQFVAVKFNPEHSRTYTYHNDGPPVAPGDVVEIENRGNRKRVTVHQIETEEPRFPTAAIIGPAPKEEDTTDA